MTPGEVVVWRPEPFDMGLGTIIDVIEIGWLEVWWHNGELGIYAPSALELADDWEQRVIEEAFG